MLASPDEHAAHVVTRAPAIPNPASGPSPPRPASTPRHVASTPIPRHVASPAPVITTREVCPLMATPRFAAAAGPRTTPVPASATAPGAPRSPAPARPQVAAEP